MKNTNAAALAAAGLSVLRPALAAPSGSVPVNEASQNWTRRDPAERVLLMEPRTIRYTTPEGKTKRLKVRQVAVWPASLESKGQPVEEVGLVECRKSGEVYYLWSHVTKTKAGDWAPMVYDLSPENLVEAFQEQADRAAKQAGQKLPGELAAAIAAAKAGR